MSRVFVNNIAVGYCRYGNIFEVTMLDKYGRMLRSRVVTTTCDVERVMSLFINDAKNM